MTCEICDIVSSKNGLVYEDDKLSAFMHPKPAARGHIVVVPKEHITIMEQATDELIGELFDKASKIGMALFEGASADGTNVIINNGAVAGQAIPHLMIHVIPRKENDGLQMQWTIKQLNEEEMSTVEIKMSEALNAIEELPPPVKEKIEEPEEVSDEIPNYLRRIP